MSVFHRIDRFVTSEDTPVSLLITVAACCGLTFTILILTITRLMVTWGLL